MVLPKSRSTSGLCNLHHRCIRAKIGGSTFLDLPRGLGCSKPYTGG